MPIPADAAARPSGIRCASRSVGLALQPLWDRVTELAGENFALQRDFSERDARIAELEAELR